MPKNLQMNVHLLKAKIHRAVVTDSSLDYQGSLGIDKTFLGLPGIVPFERLLDGNLSNGNRFETYAIPTPAGSRTICLNGAVAHLGKVGDLLVIIAFCELSVEESRRWSPKCILLSENNTIAAPISKPSHDVWL